MVRDIGSSLRALLVATLLTNVNALVVKRQATYSYYGCYSDSPQLRVLTDKATAYNTMTVQTCQADCAGYKYAGIEYGAECWCGNVLGASSVIKPEVDCSFPCPGNAAQKCGAGDRLSLYIVGPAPPVSSTTTTSRISTTISVVVPPTTTTTRPITTTTTTTVAPVATGFPAGWTSQGCWVDGANGRILQYRFPDNNALTLQSCVTACAAAGYEVAGTEYSVECYCGHAIDNGGVKAASDTECSMPCSGNAAQKCGAGGRLSLWSTGGDPGVRGAQKTGLPAGWTYTGCIQDNIKAVSEPNLNVPTFPYKTWNSQANTALLCITRCQEFGFSAAGLEYGEECFCGDPQNINVAAVPNVIADPRVPAYYARVSVPALVPEAQCNIPCPGNVRYFCGAGNLLSYYTYTGTTAKPFLDKWSFPTGANAGTITDFIGGKTVPLITGQAISGKVVFVEKGGTGLSNGTGAYELDPTNTANAGLAWREQSRFETDVFCAAGLTLPDRKGRMLTVGGWAGDALKGLRALTPSGSNGVNGTNQWQEDAANVQIQAPRWYPSAMILANGSVLVIGGEIGNNDIAEPTAEVLPPNGSGTIYLDFLQRTWPDNLYPFVAVLPSGIFIAYLNEARILNAATLDTIKTLPNMPGSVISVQSGRTYSLQGAMALLPQYAPYTAKSGVLICGGSTSGNPQAVAIDNCISTIPEDAAPVWTVERMPSKRVMPCIAGLPDGTYLIVNGAAHGVAGFGLAASANLNAVLYDPLKPVHNRMSVMANTTVARMYHSEAITLLDGRVLITGSDPTGNPNPGPGLFPNEFRVEVFTPPYLLSGIARPTFTIVNKDWAYNANVQFTVTGSTADIRVSLLGSVVSTHGNSMGQRTIFAAVTCAGQTCTVTAPPNGGVAPPGWFMMFVLRGGTPSVGVFVRIGGDPAGLGNWPANSAEFTKPGMGPV